MIQLFPAKLYVFFVTLQDCLEKCIRSNDEEKDHTFHCKVEDLYRSESSAVVAVLAHMHGIASYGERHA